MREYTLEIFDEILFGSGQSWYSSDSHNDPLGAADTLVFQAVATGISGTDPTLTCQLEHSGDGRKWTPLGASPEIDGESLTPGSQGWVTHTGRALTLVSALTFVRLRVSLAGSSPQCRLRIWATGRVSRVASGAMTQNRGPAMLGAYRNAR